MRLSPAPAGVEGPAVVPDFKGRLPGRGVWVHPRRQCVDHACRRGGLSRALRREVRLAPEALASLLEASLRSRLHGLLSGAWRARKLSLGTDATREAIAARQVRLLWVAEDAAGRKDELAAAQERLGDEVVVLGRKAEIGAQLGRGDVGVLGILDAGLAEALRDVARALAGLRETTLATHKDAAGARGREARPEASAARPTSESNERE